MKFAILVLLLLLLGAAVSGAQPIEVRIDDETVPPGALVQVKVGLTDPHPISTGRMSALFDDSFFDSIYGVSIFSPGGDVYGAAVVQGTRVSARLSSPLSTFGLDVDYPMMSVVIGTRPNAPVGSTRQVQLEASNSFWRELVGPDIPFTLKSGTITAGGSLSVSNVLPGGGLLPAGTVVRILGGGFTPRTDIRINEASVSSVSYVSPSEMRVTLGSTTEMTSKRILVRDPGSNNEVTYFSYLRAVPVALSSHGLLNQTIPLFALTRRNGGYLPAAPPSPNTYTALALQNDTLNPAEVSLDLLSPSRALLAHTTVNLPGGTRLVQEISELFGTVPPSGSGVSISSAIAIQMLGLAAEDATSTVTATPVGDAPPAQLFATPASLSFTWRTGDPSPAPQAVSLTSTGGPLTFTCAINGAPSWLSLTGSTGTTPSPVNVLASPAGLAPGTYQGSFTCTPNGSGAVTVAATLVVSAPQPSQWLALPNSLSFLSNAGAMPPPQSLTISNSGSTATASVAVSAGAPWLSYSGGSTTAPFTLAVIANPTGLAAGVYTGSITVSGGGSSVTVPVNLTVAAQPPSTRAVLLLPASGSTLNANTAFIWTNTGAVRYKLEVGRSPGAADLFSSETTETSLSVFGLPQDGSTVYVQLSTFFTSYLAPVTAAFPTFVNPVIPSAGARFVPVVPCRIADTRNSVGPFGGPSMPAGSTREFAIPASPCGISVTAHAYSLNITVVPTGPLSFLTAWPAGQTRPTVSTLNAFDGSVTANAAIIPAGAAGAISVFVTDQTDVLIDINGYFTSSAQPEALTFYPVTPCRIADTRLPAGGPFGGPALAPATSRDFPIAGTVCGVPAVAHAFSLNFTVVPSGPLSFLTASPFGQLRPNVSTLNSFDGAVRANAAIVPAGSNGGISVFATGATDVIIDINGYFAPPGLGGLSFYSLTPCRAVDTRNAAGPFGGPEIGANSARDFLIRGSGCGAGLPSAQAFAMNVTVVPTSPLAFLTAWPTGAARPLVSTLNSFVGKVVANAAIVPAGASGAVSFFATGPTELLVDLNGYFAP